jgi:hypothetical protein
MLLLQQRLADDAVPCLMTTAIHWPFGLILDHNSWHVCMATSQQKGIRLGTLNAGHIVTTLTAKIQRGPLEHKLPDPEPRC